MAEPISSGLTAARWFLGLRLGHWTTRHNRLVHRKYEDLFRWVQDETRAQESALAALAEEMNNANLFYSGAHESRQRETRENFAHRWRDRSTESDRRIEDLRDEENPLHRGWRWLARKPWPKNPHRSEVSHLTAEWNSLLEQEQTRLLERVQTDLQSLGPEAQSWSREEIADAIAELPEREKLVVTLYYYEELTLREIGETLGVSASTASRLHVKAVRKLRDRLDRRVDPD